MPSYLFLEVVYTHVVAIVFPLLTYDNVKYLKMLLDILRAMHRIIFPTPQSTLFFIRCQLSLRCTYIKITQ